MLELAGVLQLEAQRLGIVAFEERDEERQRQKRMRAQFEQLDVVVRRQRLAFVIGKPVPRGSARYRSTSAGSRSIERRNLLTRYLLMRSLLSDTR